ncbi:MAG TPA: hypothetical protein VL093_03290 [Flavipsychrobacter sp.]|jgi:hypothetical protein|nr:hypothetical protein [Flavipsychrobacter sp.]
MNLIDPEVIDARKKWWKDRRGKYNFGLVLAGIIAFICYVIVGATFIMPFDQEFEITIFTTFFQGVGYLIMILIANIFYSLGYIVDSTYNEGNNEKFRQNLFNIGYGFSILLPFLIPLLLFFQYLFEYRK